MGVTSIWDDSNEWDGISKVAVKMIVEHGMMVVNWMMIALGMMVAMIVDIGWEWGDNDDDDDDDDEHAKKNCSDFKI